jgi:hypothetical protein
MPALSTFLHELRFLVDEGNLPVRAEQLRARLKLYPAMLGGQLAGETFFVWLMWGIASHWQLLIWLGVVYVLHLLDFITWKAARDATRTIHECE